MCDLSQHLYFTPLPAFEISVVQQCQCFACEGALVSVENGI